jgi:membrane protease YdiL (CAAX protease family)
MQLETWFTPERVRISRFAVLLVIADAVTAIQAWPGGVLHVVLLSWLAWRSATTDSETEGLLLAALMMLPLIRIISLILLLGPIPESLWQGTVAVLIGIAAAVAVRRLHIAAHEIGINRRGLWLQLPLAGLGLGVGAIGFVLVPQASMPIPGRTEALIAAASAVLVAAVMEELLFRGFVLMLALPLLGPSGSLVFSALVATSLQIGYGSITNLAVTLVTSMVYGYLVLRGGSIVGVVLAHALANISFFVLLPLFGIQLVGVIALGTAVGVVAAVIVHLVQHPPALGLWARFSRFS